jgi:uncharacterized membrane protein
MSVPDRENYSPVAFTVAVRRSAVIVWMISVAVFAIWTLLIVAAPSARLGGVESISSPLYSFFGYICHQLPDRSFHILSEPLGVCSRCIGVYLGLLLGTLVYPLWRSVDSVEPPARFWLFLSLIPIGIDWSLTAFSIWQNTQASRFITGFILGVACSTFILPALVEITRNLMFRRARV